MGGIDQQSDPSLAGWKPEDSFLHRYWKLVGGILYSEVSVVSALNTRKDWPKGSSPRCIDAVRILPVPGIAASGRIATFGARNAEEFERAVTGACVELVEVKLSLDWYVSGARRPVSRLPQRGPRAQGYMRRVGHRGVESSRSGRPRRRAPRPYLGASTPHPPGSRLSYNTVAEASDHTTRESSPWSRTDAYRRVLEC